MTLVDTFFFFSKHLFTEHALIVYESLTMPNCDPVFINNLVARKCQSGLHSLTVYKTKLYLTLYPNEKILDQSKFKALVDDKINGTKKLKYVKLE